MQRDPSPPSSVSPLSEEAIAELEQIHEAASAPPWTAFRLVHHRRHDDMSPSEVGEYVKNSVIKSGDESGSMQFLAVRVDKSDGPADVCHVGNGPTSPANARCIAALHNAFPALIAEVRAGRERAAEQWRHGPTGAMQLRVPGEVLDGLRSQLSTALEERAAAVERADRYAEHIAKESYALGMGETMTPEQRVSWMRAHAEGLKNERDAALAQRDDAVKRAERAEAERDAYKRAKSENDERFMVERDAARTARDAYRAALEKMIVVLEGKTDARSWHLRAGDAVSLARAALSAEVK